MQLVHVLAGVGPVNQSEQMIVRIRNPNGIHVNGVQTEGASHMNYIATKIPTVTPQEL